MNPEDAPCEKSGDSFDDDFAAAFGFDTRASDSIPPSKMTEGELAGVSNVDDLLNELSQTFLTPEAQSPVPASGAVRQTSDEVILPDPFRSDLNDRLSERSFPETQVPPAAGVRGQLKVRGSLDAVIEMKSTLALSLEVTAGAASYELQIESDLKVTPTLLSGRCSTGLNDLGSIRFVPEVAGVDEIRFELVLLGADRIPKSRQTGSLQVSVSLPQSQTIQAAGDVIIFGERSSQKRAARTVDEGGDSALRWYEVPLLDDAAFRRRAAGYRPLPLRDRPANLTLATHTADTNGIVYWRTGEDAPSCAGIAFGTESSLGRGGDDSVHWWIRPGLTSSQDFGKLSRKHLTVSLKNSHAWICSFGANGTTLNGETLEKGRAVLLADGDQIVLAEIMSFTARLFSDEQRVTSVELRRDDELREFRSIILSVPGAPHPLLRDDHRLWIAWKESGCLWLNQTSHDWQNAPEGTEYSGNDNLKLAWYDFHGPVDQDQLF